MCQCVTCSNVQMGVSTDFRLNARIPTLWLQCMACIILKKVISFRDCVCHDGCYSLLFILHNHLKYI